MLPPQNYPSTTCWLPLSHFFPFFLFFSPSHLDPYATSTPSYWATSHCIGYRATGPLLSRVHPAPTCHLPPHHLFFHFLLFFSLPPSPIYPSYWATPHHHDYRATHSSPAQVRPAPIHQLPLCCHIFCFFSLSSFFSFFLPCSPVHHLNLLLSLESAPSPFTGFHHATSLFLIYFIFSLSSFSFALSPSPIHHLSPCCWTLPYNQG